MVTQMQLNFYRVTQSAEEAQSLGPHIMCDSSLNFYRVCHTYDMGTLWVGLHWAI